RLSRDAFEAETEPPDDTERQVVVRRGGDAHTMRVDRTERPIEHGAGGLRHEPTPARVDAQPVAELDRLVQVRERLEPDDADEAARRAIADREAARARGVPIGGARLGVAAARLEID